MKIDELKDTINSLDDEAAAALVEALKVGLDIVMEEPGIDPVKLFHFLQVDLAFRPREFEKQRH